MNLPEWITLVACICAVIASATAAFFVHQATKLQRARHAALLAELDREAREWHAKWKAKGALRLINDEQAEKDVLHDDTDS